MTFSPASQGTLFINWSETPVDGALAYFKPNKTVPKFKFTTNGGKSELIRNIQGPQIKRYFQVLLFTGAMYAYQDVSIEFDQARKISPFLEKSGDRSWVSPRL